MMTIEQVKSKVTQRDLVCRSVHVQTTLTPYPLRLVAIGRKFLSVLNEGNVRRIDPIIVTEIRM
jgi:hypothetical protein